MIDQLKTLIGEERLARLAKMPFVAERGGLEAHLQRACKDAPTPEHAVIKAIRSAGGKPTREDVLALHEALGRLANAATEKFKAEDTAAPQTSDAAQPENNAAESTKRTRKAQPAP